MNAIERTSFKKQWILLVSAALQGKPVHILAYLIVHLGCFRNLLLLTGPQLLLGKTIAILHLELTRIGEAKFLYSLLLPISLYQSHQQSMTEAPN